MNGRLGLLLTVSLALAGCATNAIRLDRASAMGQAGAVAGVGTRAVLADVEEANRAKLIAVAALDPACALPTPVITAPTRRDARICAPAGAAPVPGDFTLARFDSRAFGPAIATLEALATYLGAVDAILTAKRVDVGAELDEAIATLQAAADDITTIAGAAPPPAITDAQRGAVRGALSLISALANEAATVRELRRLETPARDAEFQATLDQLRVVNTGLADVLDQELQQQQLVLGLPRQEAREARDPREDRREEMALIERRERIGALKTALGKLVDALGTARTEYLALLRDPNAKLTDEERAKRARVAQERVLAALGAVAKLVRAF
jgi:hypothetical protein